MHYLEIFIFLALFLRVRGKGAYGYGYGAESQPDSCTSDTDCIDQSICVRQRCVDTSSGNTCGVNTFCELREKPVCLCPSGHVGNPSVNCHEPGTHEPASIEGDKNVTVTGELGQSLVLHCISVSYPPAFVSWHRGDKIISNASRKLSNQHLLIPQVKLNDLGKFECDAYNGVGKPATKVLTVVANRPPGETARSPYLLDWEEVATRPTTARIPYLLDSEEVATRPTTARIPYLLDSEEVATRPTISPNYVFITVIIVLIALCISIALVIYCLIKARRKKELEHLYENALVRVDVNVDRASIVSTHIYESVDDLRDMRSQPSQPPSTAAESDIIQRPPYPLPEDNEECKPYIHYDTPYEFRIFRIGVPVVQAPDRFRSRRGRF